MSTLGNMLTRYMHNQPFQKVAKAPLLGGKETRSHGAWQIPAAIAMNEAGKMSANYDVLGKEQGFNSRRPGLSEILGGLGGAVGGATLGAGVGYGLGRGLGTTDLDSEVASVLGGVAGGGIGLVAAIALLRKSRTATHDKMIREANKKGLDKGAMRKRIEARLREHAGKDKTLQLLTGPISGQYNSGRIEQLRNLKGLRDEDKHLAGASATVGYAASHLGAIPIDMYAGLQSVDSAREALDLPKQ